MTRKTTQDVHLVTQGAVTLKVYQVNRGERRILGNATSLEVRCIWPNNNAGIALES